MLSAEILLILRLAIVATLYAFLGWALFTLWTDLKQQSKRLVKPFIPPIRLHWAQGEQENAIQFSKATISIGRESACDVCLEDKTVSIQHARLSFHHQQWWLEDVGSTNGTLLNQEPVLTPTVVTKGDQIKCGSILLRVEVESSD